MRRTSVVFVFAVLTACGGRSSPIGSRSDGSVTKRDSTVKPRDQGVWRDTFDPDFWPFPDACVSPQRCKTSDECLPGQWCNPCVPDPCCPQCNACYPMCQTLPTPTPCTKNADCYPAMFCQYPRGICPAGPQGLVGTCTPRPDSCTDEWAPVCGCDGVTYGNACEAGSKGANILYEGPCKDRCQGVICTLQDDCCDCTARSSDVPPPSCPLLCIQNTCAARGLFGPYSYCLAGQCLLGDKSASCQRDEDCVLLNDCCSCGAFAKGNLPRFDCIQSCFAPQCVARGLGTAKASCIYGVCRVTLPTGP